MRTLNDDWSSKLSGASKAKDEEIHRLQEGNVDLQARLDAVVQYGYAAEGTNHVESLE